MVVTLIADKFKCNAQTIYKKASKEKWARDMIAEVQMETQKRLIAASADSEPSRTDIESAASINVAVIMGHREALGRMHRAADNLSTWLVKESKRARPDVRKISDALIKTAQAMHRMIPLERQAFNIDARGASMTLEEALRTLDDVK